ncbi:MAG: 50S ribosomal protein L29 [Calditrichaceae bacterium]|nr:50S ribosomal protein L29 [Calditrichaceae bacterium]
MKNNEELKGLTIEELQDRLADAFEERDNLQIQKATHQISNPLRIREVRREIARLKTHIRQNELSVAVEPKKDEK